ncbi:MAG: hypothetical protein JWM90_2910 [Thermoleophilia bacterium]|nr:hypothetical protein [Thermoleophilia bacterium]
MHDDRPRLPEGSIVNPDGSIIPPIPGELQARLDAAADEHGVIHDAGLADEYFTALVAQGDETRRRAGWPEPILEQGQVFPQAPDGDPLAPPG